jgi:hypothetical protein
MEPIFRGGHSSNYLIWIRQLTAYFCLKSCMNIDFLLLDSVHQFGESATGRSRGFRQHGEAGGACSRLRSSTGLQAKQSCKRNGEFVGAGLARDSLHVPPPIAGWSRESVRPAARLGNGLRLQADRRPAQMRPAREARSYKKCRVEITINFARLLSTRPARTIAHLYSLRRPASPSIPLRSIPLHEVEREAIYTLLPQAGEGMGESKYCFDEWRLAREPEK